MDRNSRTDEGQFEAQFVSELTEHQLALRLYVQSLMPGDPSSHDVAQQANSTIWKKRSEFELGTNFKAWMFAIARYEVLNYRKRQARDSRLVFSDEMEEVFASELPAHTDDQERQHDALRRCLSKLREKDRDLILHRYTHRTPLKVYAETMGRSAGGLRVTLHRLRAALQTCIEAQLSSPRR